MSLVELLVVLAILGVVSAIAVTQISDFSESAETQKAKRNAQTFCLLHNDAKAVGVSFTATEASAIYDELVTGKTSDLMGGTFFQISPISAEDKTAALVYCSYDSGTEQMTYNPNAGGTGQTQDPPPNDPPGEWTFFEIINNHWVAGRIADLEVQLPNYEWRWVYHDGTNSEIQFREP